MPGEGRQKNGDEQHEYQAGEKHADQPQQSLDRLPQVYIFTATAFDLGANPAAGALCTQVAPEDDQRKDQQYSVES